MCEKHLELQAEYYCVKDDEYLCHKCTLLNHKDHEIKDAKDVSQVDKIKNLIEINKLILEGLSEKTAIFISNLDTLETILTLNKVFNAKELKDWLQSSKKMAVTFVDFL